MSSNVCWLHRWQTELSPLPCDFLHIKFLLVLHLENCKAMSDDCISENWIISLTLWIFTYKMSCSHKVKEIIQFLTDSHQTLLGKFLDVVQEEILYVKCHNVREIFQFVTYAVIRHCTELSPLPCEFLHIKCLVVLHLETSQAMSDDCISEKLNYHPYCFAIL
jgi:hypothetical protein